MRIRPVALAALIATLLFALSPLSMALDQDRDRFQEALRLEDEGKDAEAFQAMTDGLGTLK